MTKIYEALQKADKERGGMEARAAAMTVSSATPRALEGKLLAVYQRIDTAIDEDRGRIVEFAGIQSERDSCKLAGELAKLTTSRLGKSVLLVGAGPVQNIRDYLRGSTPQGWEKVVLGEATISDVVYPVGESGLAVTQMALSDATLPTILGAPNIESIFTNLRENFDLVLVDAPPLSASWNAVRLSGLVDGVVLVVEAGKTRWHVVRHGMDQIAAQRGNVLGVILNRQKHYIPDFIYRRMI